MPNWTIVSSVYSYGIFYLTYFIYLMQADIRIIKHKCGKSFCIKMPRVMDYQKKI